MPARIPDETRKAIVRAFKKGGKSKAQIARDFQVSVTSVSRFIAQSDGQAKPSLSGSGKQASKDQTNSGRKHKILSGPAAGIAAKDVLSHLESGLQAYSSMNGDQNLESFVDEFISWLSRRDRGEKELISLEMAIESLRLERSSIESEISRLGSKAGSLEILIGRMRRLAENSQTDLSLVEERLENIEEKLSIDHDILLIGSAIRSILRGEELDEELVSMIAEITRLNSGDSDMKNEAVRRVLTDYSDFFRRSIASR